MAGSVRPGSAGTDPGAPSPRTGGPLGTNHDSGDPKVQMWVKGDTPGPLGLNDHADPAHNNSGGFPFHCGPDERLTASAMHSSATALMDKFAEQIFELWFNGKAPDEVTFDDKEWADYMRAETKLAKQIEDHLAAHAETLRDPVDESSGRVDMPFSYTFHAEVGSDSGGYRTGYNVLHGSNKAAGDFVVSGRLTAVRDGGPGGAYTVTYDDLLFIFNDIVDINTNYSSDVRFGHMAWNMAICMGTGPPKNYTVHIKWKGDHSMTFNVGPHLEGQPPHGLKQYRNL